MRYEKSIRIIFFVKLLTKMFFKVVLRCYANHAKHNFASKLNR